MSIDHASRQREAKAKTARRPRATPVDTEKRLEQSLEIGLRDTDAPVMHLDDDVTAVYPDLEHDRLIRAVRVV